MAELSREEYARRYGPTTGDRVRLGDTDLWIRVDDDPVGFGDEPIWGYAKNFRSRMTQFDRATSESELDMLIAGVVVVDPFLGIVKTNIGIKHGRIVGIGKGLQVRVAMQAQTPILTACRCRLRFAISLRACGSGGSSIPPGKRASTGSRW